MRSGYEWGLTMTERITCRDKTGQARLVDGCNLMDAIERLARIEERTWGVMIAEPTELQKATAEGQRKRREAERRGASE